MDWSETPLGLVEGRPHTFVRSFASGRSDVTTPNSSRISPDI
jgi:hypothetical protein